VLVAVDLNGCFLLAAVSFAGEWQLECGRAKRPPAVGRIISELSQPMADVHCNDVALLHENSGASCGDLLGGGYIFDAVSRAWGDPFSFRASQDGRYIAILYSGARLVLWQPDGGAAEVRYGRDAFYDAAFSPNGSRLATVTTTDLHLWDTGRIASAAATLEPAPASGALAVSANGGYAAWIESLEQGSNLYVRNLQTEANWATSLTVFLSTLAFNADGTRLAVADLASVVRVWDSITGG
jgi:hypothetical protein